jgi:hypothetical protein
VLKKLPAICLAASIGFACIVIAPMVATAGAPLPRAAMGQPAAPAVDAPAPADAAAPTKKHKKHKKAADAAAMMPAMPPAAKK